MTDSVGIRFELADSVGVITLDRPEKKNAFTLQMIDRWAEILREARERSDVRAIVLTGAGAGFCTGIDLDHWRELNPSAFDWYGMLERIHRIAVALDDLDKPVIAAINGTAIGAGMDMALMCDIRIASSSATFSEGYIKVGLVPGDGGCYYLPRLVGPAKALELLWTGDSIDAQEALRLGIVNRVVPDDRLLEQTLEFAQRLVGMPPVAVGLIKRAVYQGLHSPVQHALSLIKSHMVVAQTTNDSKEALKAFLEKRRPVFTGS